MIKPAGPDGASQGAAGLRLVAAVVALMMVALATGALAMLAPSADLRLHDISPELHWQALAAGIVGLLVRVIRRRPTDHAHHG